MNTTQNTLTEDPLGLKRFALTESAYDLLTSLIGTYSRLINRESDQTKPDAVLLVNWHNRVLQLNALYYKEDWADLLFVQDLITKLTIEYRQVAQQEAANSISGDYDTHTKPRTISAA